MSRSTNVTVEVTRTSEEFLSAMVAGDAFEVDGTVYYTVRVPQGHPMCSRTNQLAYVDLQQAVLVDLSTSLKVLPLNRLEIEASEY